jgi:hypothetical protein
MHQLVKGTWASTASAREAESEDHSTRNGGTSRSSRKEVMCGNGERRG